MASINWKDVYSKLGKRTEWYALAVRDTFQKRIGEIVAMCEGLELEEGKPFAFADYEIAPKVEKKLRQLYAEVYRSIRGNVVREWNYANDTTDKLIKGLFGKGCMEDNHYARFFQRNKQAMQQFLSRQTNGLDLSQRVWQYVGQTRTDLEAALDLGLGQGLSADTLSRQVREYLHNPDDLFRRFRYKKGEDADGNPIYGRKWKKRCYDKATDSFYWVDYNPKDYHTGTGVYRSSYKNAMRLTRTETNMAYRSADITRWQQLNFVLGFEVKMSKNHPCTDICDELAGSYPKEFMFVGWHPHCYCYIVPILCKDEELEQLTEMILRGEDIEGFTPAGVVSEMPPQFTNWIAANTVRIQEAQSLPYFIRDNYKGGNIANGFRWVNENAKPSASKVALKRAASIDEAVEIIKSYGVANVDLGTATLEQANIAIEAIFEEAQNERLELTQFRLGRNLHKEVGGKPIGGFYNADKNIIAIDLNIFDTNIYAEVMSYEQRITQLNASIERLQKQIAGNEARLGKGTKAFDKMLKQDIKDCKARIADIEAKVYQYQQAIKRGEVALPHTFDTTLKTIREQVKAEIHHEFGHYVDAKLGERGALRLRASHTIKTKDNFKLSISEYGNTSSSEQFAEWYARYRTKGAAGVPTEYLSLFREYEQKYARTGKLSIEEIAAIRHQNRDAKAIQKAWDERKARNAAISTGNKALEAWKGNAGYVHIDKTALEQAIAKGATDEILQETKLLEQQMAVYDKAIKVANNVLGAASKGHYDLLGIDTAALEDIVANGTASEIQAATKKLAKEMAAAKKVAMAEYAEQPTMWGLVNEFGEADATIFMANWQKHMAKTSYYSTDELFLQKVIQKELYYAKLNPTKYPTTGKFIEYFEKLEEQYKTKIALKVIQPEIDAAVVFAQTTKSAKVKNLVMELQNLTGTTHPNEGAIKAKLAEVQKEVDRLTKERLARLRKKGGGGYDIEQFYTAADKAQRDRLVFEYEKALTAASGNERDYNVIGAMQRLADFTAQLGERYASLQPTLANVDGLTEAQVQKAIKDYFSHTPINPTAPSEPWGIWSKSIGGENWFGKKGACEQLAKEIRAMGGDVSARELSLITSFTQSSNFICDYLYGASKVSLITDAALKADVEQLLANFKAAINKAIESMPRYNGITYRGLNIYPDAIADPAKDAFWHSIMQAWHSKDKTWTMVAPTSSTTSIHTADGFADGIVHRSKGQRVIMKIYGKTGVDIHKIGYFGGHESEITFRAGSKFRLLKAPYQCKKRGLGQVGDWCIEVEEIV